MVGLMKAWSILFFSMAVLLAALPLKGQVNPTTAFYWENPYCINPAFVHAEASGHFTLSARKQWIGLKGTPTTLFGTATMYLEKYRMQAGIRIINDRIGFLNSSDVALSYAYALPLRNGSVNMGLQLDGQWQGIDRNKVALEEDNDPALANLPETRKKWNAGIGIEYAIEDYLRIGGSMQHMFSLFKKEEAIFSGVNYLYARYRTRIIGRAYRPTSYRTTASPGTWDMEWGVCLKQYEEEFQADAMVSLYLNHPTQREKFQFSLLGRSIGEIGFLAGIKLMSEVKVLCSYDYNFKAWKGYNKGTFEVLLSYSLFPKKCVADSGIRRRR